MTIIAATSSTVTPLRSARAASAPHRMYSAASALSDTRKPKRSCSAPKAMRPRPFMTLTSPTASVASCGEAPPSVKM